MPQTQTRIDLSGKESVPPQCPEEKVLALLLCCCDSFREWRSLCNDYPDLTGAAWELLPPAQKRRIEEMFPA